LDSCGIVKPESNNNDEEEETEDQDKEKIQVEHTMKTILLGCLQRTEFLELKAEIGDRKIADVSFPEVVKLLRKLYDAKINVQTKRHKFLSRIQKASESIPDYISALKLIAQRCQWVCAAEECSKPFDAVFQAQFIRGVKDTHIREKLLQKDPETTLTQTLDAAMAMEAAKKENTEDFAVQNRESTSSVSVNHILRNLHSKPRSNRENNRNGSRSCSHMRQKNSHSLRSCNSYKSVNRDKKVNWFDPSVLKELKLDNSCLACGKTNHNTRDCYSKNRLTCQSCKKRGHLSKVCIPTLLNCVSKSNIANVKALMTEDEISDFEEFDFDTNHLSADEIEVPLYHMENHLETNLSKKVLVNILLFSKNQEFELDCGSPVTVQSYNDFKKLGLNWNIIKCPNICFRVYNKGIMYPLGYVRIKIQRKWLLYSW